MSIEKSPDEVLETTGQATKEKLGARVKEGEHCALLAAKTLQQALPEYMMKTMRDKRNSEFTL
jgi:hypothetical protein